MNLWQKATSKIDTPRWLEVLLGIVFLLRIPSFFEPFYYGDEMIYLTLGNAVRNGLTLYKDIHDNKPPLLYLIAGISGNIFWFKVFLAFWSLATIYFFWKLVSHLFEKNTHLQKVSVWAFAFLTTLPLLEGNIANSELFFIGPIIAGFWIILSKKNNFRNLFLGGVLFSIATLFKVPAVFDLLVIVLYWLMTSKLTKETITKIAKNFAIILIGFLTPILLSFIWYWARGALNEYFTAVFLQNIGYLSSFRPEDIQKPFLIRNLPLIIRSMVVFLGLIILFLKKNKLPRQFLFTVTWLLLTLFAVTLSERPYPHYLLQSIGGISILIGLFATSKKMEQIYSIPPLALVAFIPVFYKFYYYSTFAYYERFFKLAAGITSKQDYYNKFDKKTFRNYKIAEFIVSVSKKSDKIFVWGDAAPIYAISRRLPPIKYVAGYHINDFSTPQEVMDGLKKNPPKLIIVTPEMPEFDLLQGYLSKNYLLIYKIDDAEIWKKLKTK